MMRRFILPLLISGVVTPVLAQAPDANTQAILDALKGLNSRLDTIEERVEKVEEQPSSPAPASGSLTSTAARMEPQAPSSKANPSSPPPGMIAQPGWLVSAYPLTDGSYSSEPLVIFPFRLLPISLIEGNSQSNTSNSFAYKGEAKMNIFFEGKYNFSVLFNGNDRCLGDLKVNDDVVVSYGSADNNFLFDRKTVRPGYAELPIGSYDVSFYVACSNNSSTTFDIQVRGPNEMRPRPFKETEIFYLAPVDATSATPEKAPSSGETRNLHTGMNVRAAASVNAPIAAKLTAGDSVEVLTLSPDKEWAEVALDGRKLGFVKVTALNANSQ